MLASNDSAVATARKFHLSTAWKPETPASTKTMERRTKSRYFSVRFSADTLEKIERTRVGVYGSRCTVAEAIRRLVEDRLEQLIPPPSAHQTRPPDWVGTGFKQSDAPALRPGTTDHPLTEGGATHLSRADHMRRLASALRLTAAEISRAAVDLKAIVDEELALLAGVSRELASVPAPKPSSDGSPG